MNCVRFGGRCQALLTVQNWEMNPPIQCIEAQSGQGAESDPKATSFRGCDEKFRRVRDANPGT